jgi:hypothetical protein
MSYELLCTPRRPLPESFQREAVAHLRGLDPAFVASEAAINPLAELAESPAPGARIEVVYGGPDLPLSFAVYPDRVKARLGGGAFGGEARARVERVLGFVFSLARRFDLKVHDPQQEAELAEAELPAVIAKITASFDSALDFE